MITKTFKNRSSATDVLRALGVPTRDYNLFIEPSDQGFACQLDLAKAHVAKLVAQTSSGNTVLARQKAPRTASKEGAATQRTTKATKGVVSLKSSQALPQATLTAYVVDAHDVAYQEGPHGVIARALIKRNGQTFARLHDQPERLVADVQFSNPTNRAVFLADARSAGFANAEEALALSELARKLVHDAEDRWAQERRAAEKPTQALAQPVATFPTAPKLTRAAAPATKPPVAKPTTVKPTAKRTVTSVARELIVAGRTNEEVWAALVQEFHLDEAKRSYPAWYRRDCKKRGLIA